MLKKCKFCPIVPLFKVLNLSAHWPHLGLHSHGLSLCFAIILNSQCKCVKEREKVINKRWREERRKTERGLGGDPASTNLLAITIPPCIINCFKFCFNFWWISFKVFWVLRKISSIGLYKNAPLVVARITLLNQQALTSHLRWLTLGSLCCGAHMRAMASCNCLHLSPHPSGSSSVCWVLH